ncbi:hypothetical protein Pint_27267 [Pistacia integerrima]|uniref:Uncharacterized protein n=1 Tax=Pistacia integerrima TaxID=434235 RepID=A0ACC0YVV9_9ROSI|nr:hypothetical protein Pint_27267 [Pistacia integerrima]
MEYIGATGVEVIFDGVPIKSSQNLPLSQRNANSLVCKSWLNLQGQLLRSIRVLDWEFLESGRFYKHNMLLPVEMIDKGLANLASGCTNLSRIVVVGANELGLLSVAEECLTLQELELHKCSDNVLRGNCLHVRIFKSLKLVGHLDGFYSLLVSDIGLTILAQGCKRLVKLELSSCESSFDGIKAIGQCCQMLEELTFIDHRMDGGWMAALSYSENLKTFECQLRDKKNVRLLFRVCEAVREVMFQDCWGLDNDIFSFASVFRSAAVSGSQWILVWYRSGGGEEVGCALFICRWRRSWMEEEEVCKRGRIKVFIFRRMLTANNRRMVKSLLHFQPLFSTLKELKWRPDTKSLLASSLMGTGMGRKRMASLEGV